MSLTLTNPNPNITLTLRSRLYLLNTSCEDTTRRGGGRRQQIAAMQRAALPFPGQSDRLLASSGFPARCQSSEIRYLSRREVLEVVEGQVGDQVSGVSDDGWGAEGDVGRAQSFTVPHTKGQTLVLIHAPHVPVDGFYPGKESKTFCCCTDLPSGATIRWSLGGSDIVSTSLTADFTARAGLKYKLLDCVFPLMTANAFTL